MDESTEEKILKAAIDVFLEKGYDGARMKDIADRAKINKALLHYYFRSKENLFVTAFEQQFNMFDKMMLATITSGKATPELISDAAHTHLNFFKSRT